MDTARVLITDSAGFSGMWREVHFEVWRMPGAAAQISARFDAQRDAIRALPPGKKIITVSIVHDEATKPLDAEQRAIIDARVIESQPFVKAGGVTILAKGFKAVIIRSVIAALTLVSGAKYPSKTFDDVESMFAWLAQYLEPIDGVAPTAADLGAGYRALMEEAARVALRTASA